MQKLNLFIDPGFDGCKVIVEVAAQSKTHTIFRSVPFIAEDISARELSCVASADAGYIIAKSPSATYLVGEAARMAIMESDHLTNPVKNVLDAFYTVRSRFESSLFKLITDATIAFALNELEKNYPGTLEAVDGAEAEVVVALPHEMMEELWPIVKNNLTGKHTIDAIIDGNNVKFTYNVASGDLFYNSQVICALNNEILDDSGTEKSEQPIISNLPALIIDAGMKTNGEFKLSRTLSVDSAESNTDFAMLNVDESVAAEIFTRYKLKAPAYTIESYAARQEPLRCLEKTQDGTEKVAEIDVAALKSHAIYQMAPQFIAHLNDKYGNMLDLNSILVAGGTGSEYYDIIKDYCANNRPHLSSTVFKADTVFKGELLPPTAAIVMGLYKTRLSEQL